MIAAVRQRCVIQRASLFANTERLASDLQYQRLSDGVSDFIGGGDPDSDYNDFHSNTGQNFSGFNTPEMDAALDAGRALADPEARKEQYAIVQQILGDNVPYLWAGSNQYGVITPTNVMGVADFRLPDGSAGQPITASEFFLKDVWLKP